MKDVTFGAAPEITGGKAGTDDNSESGMLLFVPSNKGESLSSLFCNPMYQFWLHIYIYRIFVIYNYVLFTYYYRSVLLGIQISQCCLLQEAHMVIKFCFHVFHEKTKKKETNSSVEKILDAIVLAKCRAICFVIIAKCFVLYSDSTVSICILNIW